MERESSLRSPSLGKGVFIVVYMALKTLYLRESGTIQLADAFLILVTAYLMLSGRGKFPADRGSRRYLGLFLALCFYLTLINTIWSLITGYNQLRYSLYYIFNLIATFDFLVIGRDIGLEKLNKSIIQGAFYSLLISTFGLILAFGGARAVGFFNNPNQLGYSGLLMFTFILLCGENTRKGKKVFMIAMAVWAVVASSSKAAVIGIISAAMLFVIFGKQRRSLKTIVLTLLGLACAVFVIYLIFYSNNKVITSNYAVSLLRRRMRNIASESDSNLGSGRGYERIREIGVNVLWGVGEGANSRFITLSQKEVHSTYASLFVSYGLIGFVGFMILFGMAVVSRKETIRNLALCSGVLLYQMAHNGIRNTVVWLLLAVLLLQKAENEKTRDVPLYPLLL